MKISISIYLTFFFIGSFSGLERIKFKLDQFFITAYPQTNKYRDDPINFDHYLQFRFNMENKSDKEKINRIQLAIPLSIKGVEQLLGNSNLFIKIFCNNNKVENIPESMKILSSKSKLGENCINIYYDFSISFVCDVETLDQEKLNLIILPRDNNGSLNLDIFNSEELSKYEHMLDII